MDTNIAAPVTVDEAAPVDFEELFVEIGVPGVYARTGLHQRLVEALDRLVSTCRPDGAEVLRFPPVVSRNDVVRSGYLKSFPNLLGCVSVLHGSERKIRDSAERLEGGGDWTGALDAADLVLSPAACYPVYPLAARRGRLSGSGATFDVACDCFRREPSKQPDRLQSFRMREYVCLGSAARASAFRDAWMEQAQGLISDIGLVARIAPASDPFFGREGQMRGVSQIQQSLKFELLIPTWSASRPTACMSFNYHSDHFGEAWGIQDENGGTAHTACVAFGMDRLALAVISEHGTTTRDWPQSLRQFL